MSADPHLVPDALQAALNTHDVLAIAVSGGVDSVTLAHAAHLARRGKTTTVCHAVSPAVPIEATARVKRHVVAANWTLVILDAGAYGFSMASEYNSRPLPAEVMVDGDTVSVIRKRGTFDDLFRSTP